MPIRKFRSVEEMPDTVWHEPGSDALVRAIEGTWTFASVAFPRHFPPGVHKHRSREEAEAWRRHHEDADFEALQRSRSVRPR